jgi:DivIVA domain-containing protein
MPLTPEDVQNKRFTHTRLKSGYDEDEVDSFLDEVEAELRRLVAENTSLRAAAAAAPPAAAAVAAPAAPARAEDPNETALRTLTLAQRTAEEAIAQAKAEAEQVVTAARAHASTIERDATAEHAKKVGELERQRAAIEAQLGDLRGFERDHLTRVRAYLESQLSELAGLEGAASPLLNTTPPGASAGSSSAAPTVPASTSDHPAVAAAGRPTVTAPSPGAVTPPSPGGSTVPGVAGGLSAPSSSSTSGAPSSGGAGPFSTAPLPASPQDSPELFTPPASAASVPMPSPAGIDTDVDAESDVPSGPPSEADDGETDEARG